LYDPALTVGLLRKACGINGHDFSGIFKFYIGKTPNKFINYHRVEASKRLLLDARLRSMFISQIGARVGFRRSAKRLNARKEFRRPFGGQSS